MSESVIADFVGNFNASNVERAEPAKGRVLLSQKRLVLAADASNAGKLTIPLTSIFDVAVGQVPPDLGDFFQSTVTIAFNRHDRRHVAAIEADDDKIEKFAPVLFKALLNGTTMTIKHPARVGGRVTGESFHTARLFLKPQAVKFKGPEKTLTIDLSTVTGFDKKQREIAGSNRQVLAIRHMQNGQSMMSLAATDSNRKMSLLGRYLRLEYGEIVDDLRDIDLSDQEVELLVAFYSTGDGVSLPAVLDSEPSQVTMMVTDLEEKELVVSTETGTELTPKGRIVVSNNLEEVNS